VLKLTDLVWWFCLLPSAVSATFKQSTQIQPLSCLNVQPGLSSRRSCSHRCWCCVNTHILFRARRCTFALACRRLVSCMPMRIEAGFWAVGGPDSRRCCALAGVGSRVVHCSNLLLSMWQATALTGGLKYALPVKPLSGSRYFSARHLSA